MSGHDAVVVPFDTLPRLPVSGLRHTWDFHGRGDQLGTLNRLDGFYLQCSSQWDGLRHIGGPDGWYGGWDGRADTDGDHLGVQHWAERGIVGRGVLVDLVASHGGGESRYDPFGRMVFSPADLRAALDGQGTDLRFGDILCVRTGWMDMSRFLWDSGAAAVACDNPAVEAVPVDPAVGLLHRRLIPGLGFAIGELFDFGALAAACQRERRYEFLFVSVPLNVTGGVGSPANAVAVL